MRVPVEEQSSAEMVVWTGTPPSDHYQKFVASPPVGGVAVDGESRESFLSCIRFGKRSIVLRVRHFMIEQTSKATVFLPHQGILASTTAIEFRRVKSRKESSKGKKGIMYLQQKIQSALYVHC